MTGDGGIESQATSDGGGEGFGRLDTLQRGKELPQAYHRVLGDILGAVGITSGADSCGERHLAQSRDKADELVFGHCTVALLHQ